MRLIDDWWNEAKRLWSIRIALLWGAVCGLYAAWPAFQDMLHPILFAAISMIIAMAIVAARLTHQPGADL